MRLLIFIIMLKAFLLAGTALLPESTVAVVNGMALSEDDLDKEVGKLIPKSYYHSTLDEKKLKKIKKKALASLIDSTLLYQYALSKGITESDEELEKVFKTLVKAFGSQGAFDNGIKRLGFTKESFRKAVKKDEILKKLYKAEIEVHITDKELRDYYEKNKYKFKEPEQIRVSLIWVKNDPTDPKGKSKAKKRAEEAYKKIKEGADFGDIAAKYSNAMSRIKGGDMGYLHRGRLDEAVEKEAFSMKVGQMSNIIEKDIGFFIVKVVDKKVPNQLSFKAVKKGLEKDLRKKAEDKKKADLLKKLKSTAKIVK